MKTDTLTSSELALYSLLAGRIMQFMAERTKASTKATGEPVEVSPASAGDIVEHGFTSTFEQACRLLWKLDLAAPVSADGIRIEKWSNWFRLKLDQREVASFISDRALTLAPSLDEMLAAYLITKRVLAGFRQGVHRSWRLGRPTTC